MNYRFPGVADDPFAAVAAHAYHCAETAQRCAGALGSTNDLYRECLSAANDCAIVCEATARLAQTYRGGAADVMSKLLRACIRACNVMDGHCRRLADRPACTACADACAACIRVCETALVRLPWL